MSLSVKLWEAEAFWKLKDRNVNFGCFCCFFVFLWEHANGSCVLTQIKGHFVETATSYTSYALDWRPNYNYRLQMKVNLPKSVNREPEYISFTTTDKISGSNGPNVPGVVYFQNKSPEAITPEHQLTKCAPWWPSTNKGRGFNYSTKYQVATNIPLKQVSK